MEGERGFGTVVGEGLWCGSVGGLSKHGQDNWGTTEQPSSKPQHHILRQNTKWSRLQYYPAFTTPTVWGDLYDESWRGFFFLRLLFLSVSRSASLFVCCLSPILYVIFNELCTPSCSFSLHFNFFHPAFFHSLSPSPSFHPFSSSLHSSPSLLLYHLSLTLFLSLSLSFQCT